MKRDSSGKATFSGADIRTGDQRLDVFERLVYPKFGARQIEDIKRSEIFKLLDGIEDNDGARTAHVTLAYLSVVFNWYAARQGTFRSPIVRGMGRVKPRERAHERTLTDEEIRDVWAALDTARQADDVPDGCARLVRALLLTAVRRGEFADATWLEVTYLDREDYRGDVLTIPASRMKGKKDHAVPLTPAVLALMSARPRGKDARSQPFMFSTTDGKLPFSGFSKAQEALDKHINKLREEDGREPIPPWVLHDLRRTAKTLMQRAGARPAAHTSRMVMVVKPRSREAGAPKAPGFTTITILETMMSPLSTTWGAFRFGMTLPC
jgi:integrase